MECMDCRGLRDVQRHGFEFGGRTLSLVLCDSCARRRGMSGDSQTPYRSGFFEQASLWFPLLGLDSPQAGDQRVCPDCGQSLHQTLLEGQAGCPECYRHFGLTLTEFLAAAHTRAGQTGSQMVVAEAESLDEAGPLTARPRPGISASQTQKPPPDKGLSDLGRLPVWRTLEAIDSSLPVLWVADFYANLAGRSFSHRLDKAKAQRLLADLCLPLAREWQPDGRLAASLGLGRWPGGQNSGQVWEHRSQDSWLELGGIDHAHLRTWATGPGGPGVVEAAIAGFKERLAPGLAWAQDSRLGWVRCRLSDLGQQVVLGCVVYLPRLAGNSGGLMVAARMEALGLSLGRAWGLPFGDPGLYRLEIKDKADFSLSQASRRLAEGAGLLLHYEGDLGQSAGDPGLRDDQAWRALGTLERARMLSAADCSALASVLSDACRTQKPWWLADNGVWMTLALGSPSLCALARTAGGLEACTETGGRAELGRRLAAIMTGGNRCSRD